MKGGFGGSYDELFGVGIGCINISNSTIVISCTLEGNTLKGAASELVIGSPNTGNSITVNGVPYNG
jgi:hypothetical protein